MRTDAAALHGVPGLAGVSLFVSPPTATRWTVYHSRYAVGLTRAGAARYRYRGADHAHGAGAVFFFEPGEIHRDVAVESPCAYLIAFLDRELVEASTANRRLPAGAVACATLARSLEAVATAAEAGAPLLELQAATAALVAGLQRHLGAASADIGPPAAVGRARDYILDNLVRNISLAELAGEAGLGPDHLLVSFKAATGLPPHAFQVAARLARARDLLLDGMAGAEVAAAVGFADQAHLIRHFRRAHGLTPGALARARVLARR